MTAYSYARLFVCSRPRMVKEQFLLSLMPKNTPQPASSEPRVVVADTCPSGPGHDTVIVFVSLSNL